MQYQQLEVKEKQLEIREQDFELRQNLGVAERSRVIEWIVLSSKELKLAEELVG